jgi:hypothetical protein
VEPDPVQRDDPVESGALEDDDGEVERPPTSDDPVEGGSLEDEGA